METIVPNGNINYKLYIMFCKKKIYCIISKLHLFTFFKPEYDILSFLHSQQTIYYVEIKIYLFFEYRHVLLHLFIFYKISIFFLI